MPKIVVLEPKVLAQDGLEKVVMERADWHAIKDLASQHGFTLSHDHIVPAIDAKMLAAALIRASSTDSVDVPSYHRGSARFAESEAKHIPPATLRDTIRLLGAGGVMIHVKEKV